MIIGISGVAGVGKDTCADILVRRRSSAKVALADPLKRAARDMYAFTDEQLWGPSEARNKPDERYPREHTWVLRDAGGRQCVCCGALWLPLLPYPSRRQCYLTPRYALQHLGTEHGRHCYPNVWIECALRVAEVLSDGGHRYDARIGIRASITRGLAPLSVVTPDLRFKNEIDAYRAAGAKFIRVVRPGAGLAGAAGQHVSETQQDGIPNEAFDAVIFNDGTLEYLEKVVLTLVDGWATEPTVRRCRVCGAEIPNDPYIAACGRCIACHR